MGSGLYIGKFDTIGNHFLPILHMKVMEMGVMGINVSRCLFKSCIKGGYSTSILYYLPHFVRTLEEDFYHTLFIESI
jgi:hypothetical protein